MRRREIITLIGGGAATWPFAARAQQGDRMRQIGVLMAQTEDDPLAHASIKAFHDGLNKLGWTEGRTLRIDYRWAGSDPSRMGIYAADLVRMAPDVIVAHSPVGLTAVQRQTRTIPIVFVQIVDPVGAGFIQSLAKPGGNATGPTEYEFAMGGKWLELLKEIAPTISRVAVILMPEHVTNAGLFRAILVIPPERGQSNRIAARRGCIERRQKGRYPKTEMAIVRCNKWNISQKGPGVRRPGPNSNDGASGAIPLEAPRPCQLLGQSRRSGLLAATDERIAPLIKAAL